MFHLIIVIVALALVAALALATLYYGNRSFSSSHVKAEAARRVNEGTQIQAAAKLYSASEHRVAKTLDDLVSSDYLRSNLLSSDWGSFQGTAQVTDVPANQCELMNAMLGVEGVPSCADPRYMQRPVCCQPE